MFTGQDLNQASSKVIADSFFLLGLKFITGGKKAFINVTRDVLLKEYITLLPQGSVVAEILETVEPQPEVIDACKKLKQAGYLLALDDFVYQEHFRPLMEMADIIRVDFLATEAEERRNLLQRVGSRRIRFLAEKVETQEAFQEALTLGYTYIQGYFFSKPVVLSGKDIPAFKLHYLQILQEINRPELDFHQIEDIIKREVSLSAILILTGRWETIHEMTLKMP